MTNVLAEVTDIIAKHSLFRAEELSAETRLDQINVESLDLFEIIFDIEERFKIEVPDNTSTEPRLEFTTIGQIAEGVTSLLAKSKAA